MGQLGNSGPCLNIIDSFDPPYVYVGDYSYVIENYTIKDQHSVAYNGGSLYGGHVKGCILPRVAGQGLRKGIQSF